MEAVVPPEGSSVWTIPPSDVALEIDEIHIWHASLDVTPACLGSLQAFLSPDEVEKSTKYVFQKDSERFIVARGMLRSILSRYMNLLPSEICFSYTNYGKPEVSEKHSGCRPKFNVSHSVHRSLIAIARDRDVGVDIEQWKENIVEQGIAERFFSNYEVTALRSLPGEKQVEAFFSCWTRKEAYIKARGEGLSLPLHRFSVSLAPGEPAALLHTNANPQDNAAWSLADLPVGPGYSAAVAIAGGPSRVRCWQWVEQHLAR